MMPHYTDLHFKHTSYFNFKQFKKTVFNLYICIKGMKCAVLLVHRMTWAPCF